MIDFHSHILPGIDDGSASVEESIDLIQESAAQGMKAIIATPHFYPSRNSIEEFLENREEACEQLDNVMTEDMPDIYVGAEVYYFEGMDRVKDVRRLCIAGTKILLLEMPFRRWTDRMINDIVMLSRNLGVTVLMAHIDRYLKYQEPETWDYLEANDILFQVNASAFLDSRTSRKKAFELLNDDKIAVLGSDCHNMGTRKPNLRKALQVIDKHYGRDMVRKMNHNASRLLKKGYIE